jgi:hypothetical protein
VAYDEAYSIIEAINLLWVRCRIPTEATRPARKGPEAFAIRIVREFLAEILGTKGRPRRSGGSRRVAMRQVQRVAARVGFIDRSRLSER